MIIEQKSCQEIGFNVSWRGFLAKCLYNRPYRGLQIKVLIADLKTIFVMFTKNNTQEVVLLLDVGNVAENRYIIGLQQFLYLYKLQHFIVFCKYRVMVFRSNN